MSQSEDFPRERQDLKYQQEEAQKSAQQVEKLIDEVYQLKTQEIETAAATPEEIEDDKKVVKKVRFVKESSVYISQDFVAKLQEKDNVIRELEG